MDSLQFDRADRYFTPEASAADPVSKKRKTKLPVSSTTKESINGQLLKLEEEVINIHAKLEGLSTKEEKPPRKNTLSELNVKLSTILDILATHSDGKILSGY